MRGEDPHAEDAPDERPFCPECDSPDLWTRGRGWSCLRCAWAGDDPEYRVPKRSGPSHGLAGDLERADPDAIPDGGSVR